MPNGGLEDVFAAAAGFAVPAAELEPLVAVGRAAWPEITVDATTFIGHVAARASDREALGSLHTGDLYLACGVVARDRAALSAFERHFMARVPEYVMRVRVGRDVIDEIQQKLREDLVMGTGARGPKIADYAGRGALGGWLRIAAVRTALNHLRRNEARTEPVDERLAVAGDPELSYVADHARGLLVDAFQRVLQELAPAERALLRLHYIEGVTMDQLSRLYQMPRSTVARRVGEAREKILSATAALLQTERRLSPSAVASVIRQARSRLDVTLTRLLG